MKPYKEVVKEEMESDEGLFTIHRDGQTLLYEIPNDLLNKELLTGHTHLAHEANNIGYGGMKANTQVVRWQRQDDKVMLRIVSYENVADEEEPIYQAVLNSNFEPIIQAFDVKALNEDSSGVVIDVSSLFTTDVPVIGLQKSRRETYKVRRLDDKRTFITSASSYPENIEVKHVLTYEATEPPSNGSSSSISLEMNQSMIKLPEDPMQPRLCDERVGFFSVQLTDYGRDAQKAEQRCFITRWRLEPKDPAALARGELVEPVKPIVYYIDPATPEKWRPYIKEGVNDWNKAFEEAGFKNAIMAKDPPTPEEDPEFSPEDIRYSVIRYFSSPIQNAFGPHVHDPAHRRNSGERHRLVSQRDEPVAQLVFRADCRHQSGSQKRQIQRRDHGPAHPVRVRSRSRPHARLSAQLGLQCGLSGRFPSLGDVHRRDGHGAFDHGLRSLQLHRPTRRRRHET